MRHRSVLGFVRLRSHIASSDVRSQVAMYEIASSDVRSYILELWIQMPSCCCPSVSLSDDLVPL